MNKLEEWWQDFKKLPNSQKVMLGLAVAGVVGLGLYARSKNQAAASNTGTDTSAGGTDGLSAGSTPDSSGVTSTTTSTSTPTSTVGNASDLLSSLTTTDNGSDVTSGGRRYTTTDTVTRNPGGLTPVPSVLGSILGIVQPVTLGTPQLPTDQAMGTVLPVIPNQMPLPKGTSVSGATYQATGTVLPVVTNQMPLPKGTSVTGQVLPALPAPTSTTKKISGGKIAL